MNADLVRPRRGEIEESVKCLERIETSMREQFLADEDTLDIACYRLLAAIEAAIALCYRISLRNLHRIWGMLSTASRGRHRCGIARGAAKAHGQLQESTGAYVPES
jgi:hypothetical protein